MPSVKAISTHDALLGEVREPGRKLFCETYSTNVKLAPLAREIGSGVRGEKILSPDGHQAVDCWYSGNAEMYSHIT